MFRVSRIVGLALMGGLISYLFSVQVKIHHDLPLQPPIARDVVEEHSAPVLVAPSAPIVTEEEHVVVSPDLLEQLIIDDSFSIDSLDHTTIQLLEKVFEKTKDPQVMNAIVKDLIDKYQFVNARSFIVWLSSQEWSQLDPLLHLQVMFNSFPLSSNQIVSSLQSLLLHYEQNNQISRDTVLWYRGVLALMQKQYGTFFEISQGFTDIQYKRFSEKLATKKSQIQSQSDMPSYYFDALVAMELFNQGLFQPAKLLSLSALSQNKSYILPYQILAYANFLTNSWDATIEYLTVLSSLDTHRSTTYQFLLGVAYYRGKQYEKSVLVLSQVSGNRFALDKERYLVLNYLALQQSGKLLTSWQKLLWYSTLEPSDFYSYFYEVFFVPYMKGEHYELYVKNPSLAQHYLEQCVVQLSGSKRSVCEYGKVGVQLAMGSYSQLEPSLLSLLQEYPQGYLYHILGEYYMKQGNREKAKFNLLKAVGMTDMVQERWMIQKLLEEVM